MRNRESKPISIANIKVEDGAQELVRSQKMRPYLALLEAQMSGQDTAPFVAALATMPLEDRYVWRVMSALKWAFCDLETESVIADLRTLSEEDTEKVMDRLRLRTLQFCIFVCTMLGQNAGEQLILQELRSAKTSLASNSIE
jgi:hypothetical protein